MELPDGWDVFYEDVCRKVKVLTSSGVWSTDSSTVLAWLGNFQKDEHRYIAAHILDRVTFRTEKMLEGSYRLFIASTFREHVRAHSGFEDLDVSGWFETLRAHPMGAHKDICLCSVSKIGDNGDSGSHIVRILTGDIFNQNRTIAPDVTTLDTLLGKIILLVDDFIGAGTQFIEFAEETGLREASLNNHIIYAPALAYYKGLKSIEQQHYGIDVMPLEIINKSEQFFSHERDSLFCGDGTTSEIEVLNCYKDMRALDSSFGKGAWLGRDKASLSVMFQWGCPNQSLGIMWYEGNNNWNRLARRRGGQ